MVKKLLNVVYIYGYVVVCAPLLHLNIRHVHTVPFFLNSLVISYYSIHCHFDVYYFGRIGVCWIASE